ncbi:hypothetical protein D4T97_001795 [Siminovitchia acidinfaciens]|uniref:Uncharacterized protein n=1 Tax=Siminovitchia acidinfaciens TaxID=2321395 RepID=A0A429Y7G9_9BACI|nr:hypothetical protein [Siminovitchia acidinfaciens]RST77254.1 hypothetical protein D4T97_001795 [Siminovitchia acidinfaciens]
MKERSRKLNNKQNNKRLRIIFRFLIIASVMVMIGSTCILLNGFVTNLYTAFVLDFIGTFFLFTALLTICSFFLYSIFVITVFNPQRIKKSSVIKFALGGIFTAILTILLLFFGITEAKKSTQGMKDYANGKWEVEDLLVMDVYRGSRHHKGRLIRPSEMVLIETSKGEMTLFFEDFRIYVGEKYRFTYLDATNTIIKVEKVID